MPKMGWIVVAVSLALATNASAQVDTAWVRRYVGPGHDNDVVNDIAAFSSGAIAVTGSCTSPGAISRSDMVTIYYDSAGNEVWVGQYVGPHYLGATGLSIAACPDGGLVVSGAEQRDPFSNSYVLLKYSASGAIEWLRGDTSSSSTYSEFTDVCVDSKGGIYATGWRTGYALWKFSPGGAILAQCLPGLNGNRIRIDPEGHIVIVDEVLLEVYPNGGGRYGWSASKLTSSGVLLWSDTAEWTDQYICRMSDVEVDGLGQIVIAGVTYNRIQDGIPFTGSDFAMVKFSSAGLVLWERVEDLSARTGRLDDWVSDIAIASDGSILSTGCLTVCRFPSGEIDWFELMPDPFGRQIVVDSSGRSYCTTHRDNGVSVLGFDRDGQIIESPVVKFGTFSDCRAMILCPDASIAIAGMCRVVGSGERFDYGVAKLDRLEQLIIDLIPSSCPNIINTGVTDLHFHGIRPGPASANRPTVAVAILGTKTFDVSRVDPSTIEIAGLSPLSHRLVDVSRPLEAREGECECTAAGADGYTDLVLYFDQEQFVAALGPVNDGELRKVELTGKTKTGVPLSGSDCLTIKDGPIRVSPLASAGEKAETGFAAYPNPFNAATMVSFSLATESDVRLDVYDVLGRRVAKLVDDMMPAGEHQVSWDAIGAPSGVYFARLATSAGMMTRKMVLVR